MKLSDKPTKPARILVSFFIISCLTLSPSFAQSSANDDDEVEGNIISLDPFVIDSSDDKGYHSTNTITGSLISTPIKDLPQSISVATEELIDDQGNLLLDETLHYVGNITTVNRPGATDPYQNHFVIRGFQAGGLLKNGVDYRGTNNVASLERIEIVKGPTSIYGATDPGGFVNLITKQPSVGTFGSATASFGSYDTWRTELDYNTSTMEDDQLMFRFIGSFESYGTGKELLFHEETYINPMLTLKLSDSTKINFDYTDTHKQGSPERLGVLQLADTGPGATPVGFLGPRESSTATPYDDWWEDNRTLDIKLTHNFNDNVFLQAGRSTWDTINEAYGAYTFRAGSGFLPGVPPAEAPGDPVLVGRAPGYQTWDMNIETLFANLYAELGEEVKHKIVLGARYERRDGTNQDIAFGFNGIDPRDFQYVRVDANGNQHYGNTGDILMDGSGNPVYATTDGQPFNYFVEAVETPGGEFPYEMPKNWNRNNLLRDVLLQASPRGCCLGPAIIDDKQTTVFINDQVGFMDNRLLILGGLRYSEFYNAVRGSTFNTPNADFNGEPYVTGVSLPGLNANEIVGNPDLNKDSLNLQFGVNYDITDESTLFFGYSDGFKPNNFNPGVTADSVPDPEESEAWEFGVKFDGLQGKLSGSLAYFEITRSNVPTGVFDGSIVRITLAGEQKSDGVDLELFYTPNENFNLIFSASSQDARVTKEFASDGITDQSGYPLVGAAELHLSAWATYTFTESQWDGLTFGLGGFKRNGPIQNSPGYDARFITEDGYTRLDAMMQYPTKIFGQDTVLQLNVLNLSDEVYLKGGAKLNEPRRFLASMKFDF